jgi:predicted kinase
MPVLLATVGLPRCGKSTWARNQSNRWGYPIVNPDAVRLAVTGQRFVKEAEPVVWMVVKYMIPALFSAGHDVVILDATNVTHARRDQFLSKDWSPYVRIFDTPSSVCKERAIATQQFDLLPIIDSMAADWQEPSATWHRWNDAV